MTSRRLLKAAEAIREVVSMAILTELRDPRVQNVTVTGVEVAPDMRSAKVQVSIMGTDGQQHMALAGLNRSAGFLQSKLAKRIDTRYTPRLTFELDEGVKKSLEMARILHQLEEERQAIALQRQAEQAPEPADDATDAPLVDDTADAPPDTSDNPPPRPS